MNPHRLSHLLATRSTMKRLCNLLTALAFAVPLLAHAHGEAGHAASKAISSDEHAFGVQGDPKAATRTVEVTMSDTMRFVPASIPVRQGETVTFAVRNDGKLLHEIVIGTPADLASHAEMMRKHPGMEHDEPFMAHVKPGATERLTWRFTKSGSFEFACLVPGHYEAGMKGTIAVAASNTAEAHSSRHAEPAREASAKVAATKPVANPTPGSAIVAQAEAQAPASAPASPAPSSASPAPAASAATAASLADGEVRKVDTAAGKITLRHGEIRSIDMPPMTMVFAVSDPALLQGRQVGEKVRFAAERRNGAYVVTHIEPAR